MDKSKWITTYEQAFGQVLKMKFDDEWKTFVRTLEKEGHTERGISYAIWRGRVRLKMFVDTKHFKKILTEEINDWALKRNDPGWKYYIQRNEERRQAERTLEEQRAAFQRFKIGYIYFVQGDRGGPIKIGHSQKPKSRIRSLQTGYPYTLQFLIFIPGDEKTEKEYHTLFNDVRLRGEWFEPSEKLLAQIESLKKKYGKVVNY